MTLSHAAVCGQPLSGRLGPWGADGHHSAARAQGRELAAPLLLQLAMHAVCCDFTLLVLFGAHHTFETSCPPTPTQLLTAEGA